MTSDKAYAVEQGLAALTPGPWTAFNPLSNLWAVLPPYTGAWVRYIPLLNSVQFSLLASVGTAADGTFIGTIPAADSAGNPLLAAQEIDIPALTDQIRALTTGPPTTSEGAGFRIFASGNVSCYGFAANAARAGANAIYPLDPM